MKKPKMRLIGYDLFKSIRGRRIKVDEYRPLSGGSNKIDINGVLVDLHDCKSLASVARGKGCKLVPRYGKA